MLIKNANIIYPDGIQKGSVRVVNDKITEINPTDMNDTHVIDAQGLYLSPGFIDIHIHGAGGRDTMEGTKEALNVIAKSIVKHGTTSFVPTTMTMDIPSIQKVVMLVHQMKHEKTDGANIIGVHLEGPFVNPDRLGAQNPEFVLEPSVAAIKKMIDGYESDVITVTLAPEMPGSTKLIQYLKNNGIHASMGHTMADYQTAINAIQDGVCHATHLYNAMTPFIHRNPGVVGAVFDSDITTEFIADGIHIEYAALRIALKQKGTDKIILITDAMMGCTMPEGIYELGGQPVRLKNGTAKLKDGTFAGTLLTLDEAIRNLSRETEYPLYKIVKMATCNPAQYCGISHKKGLIRKGYDADLVLFDKDISIKHVIVGGNY
ncbi:MAG: N-acetylglucosamine-6-phosphate deacetylase [Anaerostipes sp.]|jgi:N-acetylglucosamine-6-phosphate deacetylase